MSRKDSHILVRGFSDSGFTLLEVLVALAILATSMYSGFQLLHRAINNTQILEDKVLAYWVAENLRADAYLQNLSGEEDAIELKEEIRELYGKQFIVNRELNEEQREGNDGVNQTFLSMTVSVATAADPTSTIEGFTIEMGAQ